VQSLATRQEEKRLLVLLAIMNEGDWLDRYS
jgi:hypothetical protein